MSLARAGRKLACPRVPRYGDLVPIARELALDEAGDLRLTNGDIVIIEGPEALAQRIQTRLRLFRGEWVHDQSRGIPWLQDLLDRGVSERTLMQILRRAILATPGVASIVSLDVRIDRTTRAATITGKVAPEVGDPVDLEPVEIGG